MESRTHNLNLVVLYTPDGNGNDRSVGRSGCNAVSDAWTWTQARAERIKKGRRKASLRVVLSQTTSAPCWNFPFITRITIDRAVSSFSSIRNTPKKGEVSFCCCIYSGLFDELTNQFEENVNQRGKEEDDNGKRREGVGEERFSPY